jgi:hypothetical protein
VTSDAAAERAGLERRLNRLASQRSALFERAGANFGLSGSEQHRLHEIERELDECFVARRQHRAARGIQRFARDGLSARRPSSWAADMTNRKRPINAPAAPPVDAGVEEAAARQRARERAGDEALPPKRGRARARGPSSQQSG